MVAFPWEFSARNVLSKAHKSEWNFYHFPHIWMRVCWEQKKMFLLTSFKSLLGMVEGHKSSGLVCRRSWIWYQVLPTWVKHKCLTIYKNFQDSKKIIKLQYIISPSNVDLSDKVPLYQVTARDCWYSEMLGTLGRSQLC